WQKLSTIHQNNQQVTLKELFTHPKRFDQYSIRWNDILVDFSKNRIDEETLASLLALADETGLNEGIEAMFAGKPINQTEGRAVLHTVLSTRCIRPIMVDVDDGMPELYQVLPHMHQFCEFISSGNWKGYTGKPIRFVVNIEIGGRDLGAVMVT